MFSKDHVARFIRSRRLGPEVAEDITKRLDEIADKDGLFSGGRIGEVLGDANLEKKFDEDFERGILSS